jgi:hypothetical protein
VAAVGCSRDGLLPNPDGDSAVDGYQCGASLECGYERVTMIEASSSMSESDILTLFSGAFAVPPPGSSGGECIRPMSPLLDFSLVIWISDLVRDVC